MTLIKWRADVIAIARSHVPGKAMINGALRRKGIIFLSVLRPDKDFMNNGCRKFLSFARLLPSLLLWPGNNRLFICSWYIFSSDALFLNLNKYETCILEQCLVRRILRFSDSIKLKSLTEHAKIEKNIILRYYTRTIKIKEKNLELVYSTLLSVVFLKIPPAQIEKRIFNRKI